MDVIKFFLPPAALLTARPYGNGLILLRYVKPEAVFPKTKALFVPAANVPENFFGDRS